MQEPKNSTFLPGATFKPSTPFFKGKELNPHCTRHLCPYDVDAEKNPACSTLKCTWMGKGDQG